MSSSIALYLEQSHSSLGTVTDNLFDQIFCNKFCSIIDQRVLDITGSPLYSAVFEQSSLPPEINSGKLLYGTEAKLGNTDGDTIVILAAVVLVDSPKYAIYESSFTNPITRTILADTFIDLQKKINEQYGIGLAYRLAHHIAGKL